MNSASTERDSSSADTSGSDTSEVEGLPRRGFRQLEDVIADESFPEVDLALRRGRHVHQGDERWYDFLLEAQPLLEPFYRRYGCELEQRNDGYFFLLPLTDSLGKRHLGVPEMIVGQGLALCFLDPKSVQCGGVIAREELLNQLAAVMGPDALMRALNPKRKRVDERVMQRTVRQKVNEALRRLAQLGFVELLDGDQLRLWPSLMRFAEPVRGLEAPSEALKRLIERGEISLGPGDDSSDASGSDSDVAADADSEDGVDADAIAEAHLESASDMDAEADSGASDPSSASASTDPVAAASASVDGDATTDMSPDFDLSWDELPPDQA
jgi:chromosome partition protein MukE